MSNKEKESTCDCAPCQLGGTWAPRERLRRRDRVIAAYGQLIGSDSRYSPDKFRVVERLNDQGHLQRAEFMYGDATVMKQCWCEEADVDPHSYPTCRECRYTQLYYAHRGTERFWLPPLGDE